VAGVDLDAHALEPGRNSLGITRAVGQARILATMTLKPADQLHRAWKRVLFKVNGAVEIKQDGFVFGQVGGHAGSLGKAGGKLKAIMVLRDGKTRYHVGMTMPQRVKRYTPEEYYRLEQEAEGKSDYYDGQIFAMSGGTVPHNRIAINLVHELEARFEKGPCRTHSSDLRLKIAATGLRTYPDVTVYCDEIQLDPEDSSETTAVNPTAIFEVLSKSTEAYDRGFKFDNYREIKSLRAFVLVSQTHPQVEIYERNGDAWEFRAFKGIDEVLRIPPLKIEIPLARIYRNVEFEPTLRPFEG